jgi:hypothetical protein
MPADRNVESLVRRAIDKQKVARLRDVKGGQCAHQQMYS